MSSTEILTGALVLISGWYAWLTRKMARATERSVRLLIEQAEAGSRPYIEVAPILPPGSPIFYLRIRNVGRTAALNLRLTMDRDYYAFGDRSRPSIRSYAAFQQATASFAPNEEIVFFLGQGFVVVGSNADESITPSVFEITAAYQFGVQSVSEKHIVDLRPYLDSAILNGPLAHELEEINKTLGKCADAIAKIARPLERVSNELETRSSSATCPPDGKVALPPATIGTPKP